MRRKVWSASDLQAISDQQLSRSFGSGGEGSEAGQSDVRLKEHVTPIGRTRHELPLYRLHYKGRPEAYAGVMAQDVLKVMPEAVSVGDDGFYRVNYKMLGIKMVRLDDGAGIAQGGEGVTEESDFRLKDRIERIGTIAVKGRA